MNDGTPNVAGTRVIEASVSINAVAVIDAGAGITVAAMIKSDALSEQAARLFERYLCDRYPDLTWIVRVRREGPGSLDVVPPPLAGDVGLGVIEPDDVDPAG